MQTSNGTSPPESGSDSSRSCDSADPPVWVEPRNHCTDSVRGPSHTLARAIRYVLLTQGMSGLALAGWRRLVASRARIFASSRPFIEGKAGLEIGGPSALFRARHLLPVYPRVRLLDNCTFSTTTIWERELREGPTYSPPGVHSKGYQFVNDATELRDVVSHAYDFVLSSHVLEHVANPLKALAEWQRVIKPGGALLIVVPDHLRTFDHRRRVTNLEHFIEDRHNQIGEDDLTHLDEVLRLTDLSKSPDAQDVMDFARRARCNAEYRGMHHHVFDARALISLLEYAGFRVIDYELRRPHHIMALAIAPDTATQATGRDRSVPAKAVQRVP